MYREVGALEDIGEPQAITPNEHWSALYIEEPTAADFSDSNEVQATAEEQPIVRMLLSHYPMLANYETRAGLAQTLREWTAPPDWRAPVRERTDIRVRDEQKAVGEIVKRITYARLRGQSRNDALFQQTVAQVWNDCKKAAGIALGMEVSRINDLSQLATFKRHALALEQREKRRHA